MVLNISKKSFHRPFNLSPRTRAQVAVIQPNGQSQTNHACSNAKAIQQQLWKYVIQNLFIAKYYNQEIRTVFQNDLIIEPNIL